MADETTTPGGIDPAILELLLGNANAGIEGQMAMSQMGIEAMDKWKQEQRADLEKAKKEATELYKPYIDSGWYWGGQAKDLIEQGAPKYTSPEPFQYESYKGQDPFQYEQFKFDQKPNTQTWDEYAKTRLGPENIEKSNFYDLYQWEQDQQQKAIERGLRARGQYNSGRGIMDEAQAQTGLGERFAADEYNRGRSEWGTNEEQKWREYQDAYEKALQGHTMGYGEAKDKYGMTEEALLRAHNMGYGEELQKYGLGVAANDKAFGVEQGQWQDKLNTALGLRDDGWKGTLGSANAALGTGSQLGTGAIQTGQAMLGLYGQTGQGIGQSYNALNNQLGSVYGNTLNYGLGLQGLNQGQANFDTANNTNAWLGAGTIAARAGQGLWDYYNKPVKPVPSTTTTGFPASSYYDNYWGGSGGDYGSSYGDPYGDIF